MTTPGAFAKPTPDKPAPLNLEKIPLTQLRGVGPSLSEKLANIHIHNVLDLLFHLPLRYQDRTRLTPIAGLKPGLDVVIEGTVVGSAVLFGRRRSLLVKIQDGTGLTNLRFFHFSAAQKNNLYSGQRIRCFGEVRWGKGGMEMYHPEYKVLKQDELAPLEQFLTPVYPTTEGLHQTRIRSLMEQAFLLLKKSQALPDYLPEQLSLELGFVSLADALQYLHNPPTEASLTQLEAGLHPAQVRLAFEELLANYLCLRRLRDEAHTQAAPPLKKSNTLIAQLLQQLPFTLTSAQQRVSAEVSEDICQSNPMLRLVQGDVGSGKTLIAVLGALQSVESNYQAAIMAPTEILAEQHYLNFEELLQGLNINICFLSGKIKGKKRDQVLAEISTGSAQIVIGTHALFQEQVHFARLGLMVIDEQHRFGVHQRLALREKGRDNIYPHQLIMTATPIPRTLTMSVYADLDCSVIDELPPGRTPVNTVLISDQRRHQIIERIQQACSQGRQAYWVCTLIEESDVLQCQAAEATYAELSSLFSNLTVGLIHGRMKPKEKTAAMNAFKAGEIHLLVATTVIEVGVDVPNASIMIIENPERLGLAQLHQLRGRVGRGSQESHCMLLYHSPLSTIGKQRLEIMRSSNDGFFIAEKDLEIRGPGEVLGTRQTGLMDFKIADLSRDSHLQEQIKIWAEKIRMESPGLVDVLINRWLAENQRYGNV
ncbi:ATP-dependent DNA helicase RecG [Gammaproteobacteria bacterium]|nr:ATP-dependent DNA helicase RecG [Gammaproteobacteria bacterium]